MSDDILTPDDLGETPEYNNLFRNRDLTSFFLLHMTNDCSVEDFRRSIAQAMLCIAQLWHGNALLSNGKAEHCGVRHSTGEVLHRIVMAEYGSALHRRSTVS